MIGKYTFLPPVCSTTYYLTYLKYEVYSSVSSYIVWCTHDRVGYVHVMDEGVRMDDESGGSD